MNIAAQTSAVRALQILLTLACGHALVACSTARRLPPVAAAMELTAEPALATGRDVFQAHCHSCHPGGEAGLGPALNNKPLPGFLVRFQVRHGLGAMPAFDETALPAADLDALVAYLAALRRNAPLEPALERRE